MARKRFYFSIPLLSSLLLAFGVGLTILTMTVKNFPVFHHHRIRNYAINLDSPLCTDESALLWVQGSMLTRATREIDKSRSPPPLATFPHFVSEGGSERDVHRNFYLKSFGKIVAERSSFDSLDYSNGDLQWYYKRLVYYRIFKAANDHIRALLYLYTQPRGTTAKWLCHSKKCHFVQYERS